LSYYYDFDNSDLQKGINSQNKICGML